MPPKFAGAALAEVLGRTTPEKFLNRRATGRITDRVMFRADASSPEQPYRNGRVWLLRLVDGRKAWEGYSDADGNYTAEDLELGVEYIAVGIDPYRNHKTTGAGPVTAT